MMPNIHRRFRGRRASTMVEGALALLVFGVLLAGIMELGLVGLIANSISFAAQRAVRYAAVRGSASGHAAQAADIKSVALQYAAPLSTSALNVTVTWTPNNNPGSTVTVQVAYSMPVPLLPLSPSSLSLHGTASETITQ